MAEKPENRRIRMTKQLLKDALLELLEKKDLIDISITEICECADIHRTTFYRYYANTSELLKEIQQDFQNLIPTPAQIHARKEPIDFVEESVFFLDLVKRNQKIFHLQFDDLATGGFQRKLVDYLCEGYIPSPSNVSEMKAHLTKLYVANGIVGILQEWMETDYAASSREIAELLYDLSKKVSY